jgi:hypothetical protein
MIPSPARPHLAIGLVLVLAEIGLPGCHSRDSRGAAATSSSAASAKAAPKPDPLAAARVAFPAVADTAPRAARFGDASVTVTLCKLDTSAPPMQDAKWWDHTVTSMAVAGDGTIYVLDHQQKLRHYVNRSPAGCELVLDPGFGKGGVRDVGAPAGGSILYDVSVDAGGGVHVSSGGVGTKDVVIRGEKQTEGCEGTFRSSPSSSFAVVQGNEIVRGAGCTGPHVTFAGFDDRAPAYDAPHVIGLLGDEMVVAGTDMVGKQEIAKVGLHGADGKQRLKLGKRAGDERIDGPKSATRCGKDLCVLAGTFDGVLYRWSPDGAFEGKLSLGEMKPSRVGAYRDRIYVSGATTGAHSAQIGLILMITHA